MVDAHAGVTNQEHMATQSAFECSVCLRFLHEPVTLACGHSFCRRCCLQCMQVALRCPQCRCDVPFEAAHPQPSLTLQHALQLLHPNEVSERLNEESTREEIAAVHDGIRSLPLFILEPLLPGQTIQLHVFEPRYIRLTQRALAETALGRCFGMTAMNYQGVSQFGTTARIIDANELDGGRYFLTVKGHRRFRILRTWNVDGYHNAQVAWAQDAPSSHRGDASSLEEAEVIRCLLDRELRTLLQTWMAEVSHGWERSAGQLEQVVEDIGQMPDEHASLEKVSAAVP